MSNAARREYEHGLAIGRDPSEPSEPADPPPAIPAFIDIETTLRAGIENAHRVIATLGARGLRKPGDVADNERAVKTLLAANRDELIPKATLAKMSREDVATLMTIFKRYGL